MKKYIWVSKIFEEYSGEDGWPPENHQKFILWFEKKISEVPPECRESLTITWSSDHNFGAASGRIVFKYKRLETDQEEELREKRLESESLRVMQQELETLEKLKAKYGK